MLFEAITIRFANTDLAEKQVEPRKQANDQLLARGKSETEASGSERNCMPRTHSRK